MFVRNVIKICDTKKHNCSGLPTFKSQRVGYQSNQKYCITISIQKISPIHKFNRKVQQILGSYELKRHGHFWWHPPENNWINFYLSWICTSMKKMTLYHLFISDSRDQTGHTHFWPCPTKKCLISF